MNPEVTQSGEVGAAITIPPAPAEDVIESGSDTQALFDAQAELFAKKEAPPADTNGVAEHEDAAPPPPPKKAKKNRAAEIADTVQKANKSIKAKPKKEEESAEPKEGEEEFDGTIPDFDSSRFIAESSSLGTEAEPESEEPPAEVTADVSKETNLKKLRQIATATKEELATLKQQLEERPEPKVFQEKISALEARVKELEPYEFVFGLHNNPQFKQKYLDGESGLLGEMGQIAKDYGVETQVVNEFLLTNNRKDEDAILEENFPSISSRMDLKTLKQRFVGLRRERAEAEKQPQVALEKLRLEEEQTKAERARTRDLHFESVSQRAWERALSSSVNVAKEDKIYELIEIPGKKDHNEKVVQPTLNDARATAQVGLKHIEKMIRGQAVIDEKFASWFTTICQQAAATRMVNHVRWGIHEKLQEVEAHNSRQNGYDRPGLSTPSRSAGVKSGEKKKMSSKEVAGKLFLDVVNEEN